MKTEKLKFSILGLNEGSNYEIEIYKPIAQFFIHFFSIYGALWSTQCTIKLSFICVHKQFVVS